MIPSPLVDDLRLMYPHKIEVIKLNSQDAEALIEALENPPEPNERFLAAARRHVEWTKLSAEEQEAILKDDYDLNKEIVKMVLNNKLENK
ncbi:MAG: DUF1778 domain-containing protein [Cetobacterium sp.]|uniref:type II toxin-antitoxin system TacA family antitoxin n=1 Tax=Cetobacterium sp. TaxID=2071632 RepID=UPI003EE7AE24